MKILKFKFRKKKNKEVRVMNFKIQIGKKDTKSIQQITHKYNKSRIKKHKSKQTSTTVQKRNEKKEKK